MQGVSAVKRPIGVDPRPMDDISHRLASVQFKESMPWLAFISRRCPSGCFGRSLLEQLSKAA